MTVTFGPVETLAFVVGGVALLCCLLAAEVLRMAGRPTTRARPVDRWRIGWALVRYDFWLSVFCVPGRRARALRRELRSNLWDAAARVGSGAAVSGLGSIRAMARLNGA